MDRCVNDLLKWEIVKKQKNITSQIESSLLLKEEARKEKICKGSARLVHMKTFNYNYNTPTNQ